MNSFVLDLAKTLASHGFREVTSGSGSIPDAEALLKRQTWMTNRAVVVVSPPSVPSDFGDYISRVRRRVAFHCKFFPFLWGIGIQLVAVSPGIARANIDPTRHVARLDNQWAIIQSVFLVDPESQSFSCARSWGQFLTGKYQDAIEEVLWRHFDRQA